MSGLKKFRLAATGIILAGQIALISLTARLGWAAPDSLTVQIQASADDADSNPFSVVNYTRSYLNLPAWSRGFWRFSASIPQGSMVDSAYLRLRADSSWSGTHIAHLRLLDEANCADFTTDPYNHPTWGDVPWTTPSATGGNLWHTSTDISPLIQHFIEYSTYTPGNYLCLGWFPEGGSADRSVWSFDGGYGAQLEITYTEAGGAPSPTATWTSAPAPTFTPAATATSTATSTVTEPPGGEFSLDSPYAGGPFQHTGQLHTHSKDTGGLEDPSVVESAYRDAGYDFIALTGQNAIVPDPGAASILHISESEEVWQTYGHIAVLDIQTLVPTTLDAQQSIDEINSQGGLAILAHPNFSVAPWDDTELNNLSGYHAIEIKNGYVIHQEGTGNGSATIEWDMLLSNGRRIWGVGVDDAHSLADGIFNTYAVRVFSQLGTADQEDLSAALRIGNFYTTSGSNGPRLEQVATANETINLTLQDVPSLYSVSWYGSGGLLLETDNGVDTQASYTVSGSEGYVRAEVQRNDDNGRAWLNPIFVVSNQPTTSPTSTFPATSIPTNIPTPTPTTPPGSPPYLDEDFESYLPGAQPAGWVDQAQDFNVWDYFQTLEIDEQVAYGPVDTGYRYTHYNAAGALGWQNYEVTGRLRFGQDGDGISLTFYSQFPAGVDRYYQLLRYSGESGFRIHAHGTDITHGNTAVDLNAQPNTWYRFRLRVQTVTGRVRIVAKVWAEGQPEPVNWQIDCYDASATRITTGAIGFWSQGIGTRAVDDLRVQSLDPAPLAGFPLGLYDVAADSFAPVQAAGVERVHRYDSTQSEISAVNYLQAAEAAGLEVLQNMPSDYLNYEESFWTAWLDAVSPFDTLAAWYLPEEPGDLTSIERLHDLIRLRDPRNRPAGTYFADLTTLDQWCQAMDVLFIGAYPEYSGSPRASMMARLDIAREACPGRPLIGVPMFFDTNFDATGDYPTPHEARADAYTALIAGAQGLEWYSYQYGQNLPDLWFAVKDIIAELKSLKPVIIAPDSSSPAEVQILSGPLQSPETSGRVYDSVQILQKTYQGDTYLFAVNLATDTVGAGFSGLPLTAGEALVMFEERTVPVTSGGFNDTFAPADVHVYKLAITAPTSMPTPTSTPEPASTELTLTRQSIVTDWTGAIDVYGADMDSDSDLDILAAAYHATDAINWWENDGNENFTAHNVTMAPEHGIIDILPVDLDQDGDLDVLAASAYGSAPGLDAVLWYENDGNQNFTERTVATNVDYPQWVGAADLDGDNDLDVVATAFDTDQVLWFENDGFQNFTRRVLENDFSNYDKGPLYGDVIDLDQDGDQDVVVTGQGAPDIAWWSNDGSGNFVKYQFPTRFSSGGWAVRAADLDADSDLDLVLAAFDGLAWFENDGNQNFTERVVDGAFASYNAAPIFPVDLDRDGDMDVVGGTFGPSGPCCTTTDDDIVWWENDGNENFTRHVIEKIFAGPWNVFVLDLDQDGDNDVLGAADYDHEIAWWENVSGPAASPTPMPPPTNTPTPAPSNAVTATPTPPAYTPTAVPTPTVTPTPVPGLLLQEDFESYPSGSDPVDWRDQRHNLADGDVYKVATTAGSQVLAFVGSNPQWQYSHYNGAGATSWQNYQVSGRLNFATAGGSAGLTFYSRVPSGQNAWYLLLRYANENQFRLYSSGSDIGDCTGGLSTPLAITPGAWYWFRVQIETASDRVLIRARVWEEGQIEPAGWPIDCYDAYAARITAGTVGIWTEGAGGQAAIDDIVVSPLSSP